jgi:hypothetical protein
MAYAIKKVEITSRIIGNFNCWIYNTEKLQELMKAAFHSTSDVTRNRIALAEFLNSIAVKRNFLNKWHIFRKVERGLYIERGEKTAKVVVRNWNRRHIGDKA